MSINRNIWLLAIILLVLPLASAVTIDSGTIIKSNGLGLTFNFTAQAFANYFSAESNAIYFDHYRRTGTENISMNLTQTSATYLGTALPYFSSSNDTQKTITSGLSTSVNGVIAVNSTIACGSLVPSYQGTNITYNTCSGSVSTYNLTSIPNGASIFYLVAVPAGSGSGSSGGGGGGGVPSTVTGTTTTGSANLNLSKIEVDTDAKWAMGYGNEIKVKAYDSGDNLVDLDLLNITIISDIFYNTSGVERKSLGTYEETITPQLETTLTSLDIKVTATRQGVTLTEEITVTLREGNFFDKIGIKPFTFVIIAGAIALMIMLYSVASHRRR
jgi:hypothetical protein